MAADESMPDNMSNHGGKRLKSGHSVLVWLFALASVLAFFYGMDHLIMSLQGLPLHLDLSPAR